jgi:parvulin-like peptidyl-prolyl isomerase
LLIVCASSACSEDQSPRRADEGVKVCVSLGQRRDRRTLLAQEAVRRGLRDDRLLRRVVADRLAKRLMTKLRAEVSVSDAEVDQRMKELDSRTPIVRPARVWLLKLVTKDRATADTARADLLAREGAQRRSRFRELARSSSIDEYSRRRGGSLGFVAPETAKGCANRKVVVEAKRDAVFGPCEQADGWHLYLKIKNSERIKLRALKRRSPSRERVRRLLVEEKVSKKVLEILRRGRRR